MSRDPMTFQAIQAVSSTSDSPAADYVSMLDEAEAARFTDLTEGEGTDYYGDQVEREALRELFG